MRVKLLQDNHTLKAIGRMWQKDDMMEADKETTHSFIINLDENGSQLILTKGLSAESVDPKTTTMYLHSSKESSYETAKELGLSEDAAEEFCYALYEVGFVLEVFPDGKYKILEVTEGEQKLVPV
ncbi:hypothetical protein LCGC14_1682090 [marine sediment metagenome]|uniref:Uncharacterized protein n=1 Tax=marine sediment metagenome TaxID=412755 RepID=A0A0F9HNE7_9ZZZZ